MLPVHARRRGHAQHVSKKGQNIGVNGQRFVKSTYTLWVMDSPKLSCINMSTCFICSYVNKVVSSSGEDTVSNNCMVQLYFGPLIN